MTRKTPTPDPDGRKDRLRHRAAHALFGLLVAAFVVVVGLPFAGLHVASLAWLAPTPGPGVGNYRALRDEDMAALTAFAGAVWAEPDAMPSKGRLGRFLGQPSGGVYVALREHGHRLAAVWNGDGTIGTSLAAAIRRARHVAGLDGVAGENVVLEVDIAHDYRRVNDPASSPLLASSSLGVLGLEITRGNVREKLAPTYMLSTNRSYAGFIKLFRDKYGIDKGDFARTARLRVFEADQVLVSLAPSSARLMTRGNRLVDQAEVTGPTLKQAVKLGAEWLIDNVQSDGRMVYMYWPSAGRESGGNNMIRQWMATLAMEQVAARISDRSMWSLIARNIRYNLDHFYREEDGLGLIDYRGQVSLGSVALAALALREHPGRQRWEKQEAALERTVASLWNQDGSFRTFYEPKGRNDEQNYYPGEAMLLWATVIAETHDRALLDKYMKSFRYYRAWHLDPANRNPAFVPWQTEAAAVIWHMTKDKDLLNFVFEMNDWLLKMQQGPDDVPSPEMVGRFYDPHHRYGPPHASADGVYLEGLADAYRLAVEVKDVRRQNRYRAAMKAGLRHVLQLQFADDTDMYYVPDNQKVHVRGGIRTTEYDNRIRCDNVQHNVVAMIKAIEAFRD